MLNQQLKELNQRYAEAKKAKVGEDICCPSCKIKFAKKYYQQAFCNQTCKDFYWNNVTPNKRNNTTRISPANAAWMAQMEERRENRENFDDDLGWDAHKDSH